MTALVCLTFGGRLVWGITEELKQEPTPLVLGIVGVFALILVFVINYGVTFYKRWQTQREFELTATHIHIREASGNTKSYSWQDVVEWRFDESRSNFNNSRRRTYSYVLEFRDGQKYQLNNTLYTPVEREIYERFYPYVKKEPRDPLHGLDPTLSS